MATNGTCSPAELQAALSGYLHGAEPTYASLMIATMLGTLLIPFLFSLCYFATGAQWRTPMFLCVIASVLSAIVFMGLQIALEFQLLLHPLANPGEFLAIILPAQIIADIPNFMADVALLYRMLALFPPSIWPLCTRCAVVALPIALKVCRLVTILVLVTHAPSAHGSSFSTTDLQRVNLVLNRVAAAVDTTYASAVFVIRLRSTFPTNENMGRMDEGPFRRRITALFWLALSSFAIPVPMVIAQAVLLFGSRVGVAFAVFQYLAAFTSAVCIAFATVWLNAARPHPESNASHSTRHTQIAFARPAAPARHSLASDGEVHADIPAMKTDNEPAQVRVSWAQETHR